MKLYKLSKQEKNIIHNLVCFEKIPYLFPEDEKIESDLVIEMCEIKKVKCKIEYMTPKQISILKEAYRVQKIRAINDYNRLLKEINK